MRRCLTACLLWIGLSVAPLLAHACPATLPAGLSGASVGQDLITNGLAMSITQVEGRETVNELLNRAEKTWTAAGFKVKRNHAAGWGIVSALSGQCLATLQLTDRRGAFGYFSRGKPASVSAGAAAIKDAPLPHGAKITSSVSSDDDGRKGMTLSMTSTQAMQDLLGFFMKHLHANQWQGTRATAYAPAKPGVASMLISAQRDRQQIQIMMWAASETQIVMTLGEAI